MLKLRIAALRLLPLVLFALAACGGGGGGGGGGTPPDTTAPTVSLTSPVSNATGVALNAVITATFSETMKASTINATTFTLSNGVTGTVAYSGTTATFTPSGSLAYSTTYTATITTGAQDLAGNALAANHVWTFTTAANPTLAPTIPLTAGKRWLYDIDRTTTVVASSTGVQTTTFVGERLLHVEQELSWQGRNAWKLGQYDLQNSPASGPGFIVSAPIYISQSADGLDKWVATGTGGEWRRILSNLSLTFNNNTFLMAGGPAHAEGTTMTLSIPVTVPAGSYDTVRAYHEFRQTGQYAPEDIFEYRWEYYADGVGLVKAAWDYSFDDNDPSGTDIYTNGTINLKTIDGGPTLNAEVEPNDASTAGGSQAVSVASIVAARTNISDAGAVVVDANVSPNILGQQLLQDWYRLVLPATATRHIALVYTLYASGAYRDLDLYLFRENPDGSLAFVDRSVLDPSTSAGRDGEWIHQTSLAAGTYYIAVQAWDTPTGAVDYWLSIR